MKNQFHAMSLVFMATAVLASAGPSAAGDVSVTGFLRLEAAPHLSSEENPYNQFGNEFNGVTVVNSLGNAITRGGVSRDTDFNVLTARLELDIQARLGDNWTGYAKLRGLYDGISSVNDQFGDPSAFEVPFRGSSSSYFEAAGADWMLDLPALYLDYNKGPYWLRFGNQQIAWGESIFFRVLDVPSGLDTRRHLILDVAAEEYADERIAAPGVRGSVRFGDWELEGFGQLFQPTVINNENTPFNLVPAQFVVQQEQGFDAVDGDWNAGVRLRGQEGDLGIQFIAVRRLNPDGVFRWTESGINPFAGIPGLEALGALLAGTPFEISPQGVWSAEEWFRYASLVRLDGVEGLNSAISEFPASQLLGAFVASDDPTGVCVAVLGITDPRVCAALELDIFFDPVLGPLFGGGLGPLRGHLAREYFYENVYGIGLNYLVTAEPGSFLDQLVVRFEATMTPDRTFTNPSLSRNYIVEDELVASLVFEKYHKFSHGFPATFFVLEHMYRSESDLFGRHLSGNDNDGVPRGDSGFNASVFAVQQPFPNLIWRFDLSVLYDWKGGLLVQPAVRWKPNDKFILEAFYNHLDSDGGNDDIMQTIEWADELGLRFTYQF